MSPSGKKLNDELTTTKPSRREVERQILEQLLVRSRTLGFDDAST